MAALGLTISTERVHSKHPVPALRSLHYYTELSYIAHWRPPATATLAHPQQQKDNDDAILSDIHVGSETDDTLYALRYRTAGSATDADGDLDPPRRRTLLVEHARATPLADVGLQVWRGALVVCDWLLAEERGAALARRDDGARRRPALSAARGGAPEPGAVHRRPPRRRRARGGTRRGTPQPSGGGRPVLARLCEWRAYADAAVDADDALGAADVVVAADCIYDDAATTALFDALRRALAARPGRYAVVALEKRFNFEAESLSVVAHGYRTFRRALAGFDAVRLALPPRFVDYDRGDAGALELWRVGWLV